MDLPQQIHTLENSGLVRLSQSEPELEYIFRHALVQDAAYASMLKSDRRQLHRIVGEALEQLYKEHSDELAPQLGRHFSEAGEYELAIQYLQRAGDLAAGGYALNEAITHYTLALEAAQKSAVSPHAIYRARGKVYETLGDFEHARADHEAVLADVREKANQEDEWQALLDLGALWAGRDYQRTGQYFLQAYELARATNDQPMLGHSLNRLANWYLNINEPLTAAQYHQQALAIFEKLNDKPGTAETLDLLGMTSFLSGNSVSGNEYLQHAIHLFRQMGENYTIASSLSTISLSAPNSQTDIVINPSTIETSIRNASEALEITRRRMWRAGEAFALFTLSQVETYGGRYAESYECASQALAIAQEIGHRQWAIAATMCLGCWHLSLLAFPQANQFFEKAYSMSQDLGSGHWQNTVGGLLAWAYLENNEIERAEDFLVKIAHPGKPAIALGERLLRVAQIKLALARSQAQEAGQILDEMYATIFQLPNYGEDSVIRLGILRAAVHLQQKEHEAARGHLLGVLATAQRLGAQSILWRLYASLSEVSRALSQPEKTQEYARLARENIQELARAVPDAKIRKNFVNRANSSLKAH
jgi:tetratricopeptide (TPR) repeat protein